jgi:transposase
MQVVYPCCCGLDVHKKSITACVLWVEERGEKRKEKRVFGTFTRDLLKLSDWLRECGVRQVALESTGIYWKPVWNILEGQFEVLLVTMRARANAKAHLHAREALGYVVASAKLPGPCPPRRTIIFPHNSGEWLPVVA